MNNKIYSVDRKTELKNGKVISDYILISSERALDGIPNFRSNEYLRVDLGDVSQLLEKLQSVRLDKHHGEA